MAQELDTFLTTAPVKNSIIFINEAGDFLHNTRQDSNILSSFKILLDPDNVKLKVISLLYEHEQYSKTNHVCHDISKITFILTGNHTIKDYALVSRMEIINFPKIALEQRKRIAQLIWKQESRGESDPYSNQTKAKATFQEIILKTDQRFDGVREMKRLIQNFIVELYFDKGDSFDVDHELESINQ